MSERGTKKRNERSTEEAVYLFGALLLNLFLYSAVSAKHFCSVRQRLFNLTDLSGPREQVPKIFDRLEKAAVH